MPEKLFYHEEHEVHEGVTQRKFHSNIYKINNVNYFQTNFLTSFFFVFFVRFVVHELFRLKKLLTVKYSFEKREMFISIAFKKIKLCVLRASVAMNFSGYNINNVNYIQTNFLTSFFFGSFVRFVVIEFFWLNNLLQENAKDERLYYKNNA